jgi:ferritin-like metal-binding protein YciE
MHGEPVPEKMPGAGPSESSRQTQISREQSKNENWGLCVRPAELKGAQMHASRPKYQNPTQPAEEYLMKLFSENIKDLETLYVNSLKKAYDMEIKITKSLPDMIEHATDPELNEAFGNHLEQTRAHVLAIEGLLQARQGEAKTEICKVIGGLTTEAEDLIKDVTDSSVCDVALISAAQQVEHHEIAVYGTLRRWAELLGLEQDASILEAIEADELGADELLTEISERVNLVGAA